ncbi:hypothetical protein V6N11_008557 [Hibiscus sabdariffa]|uniref:Uncharacterized protein n=1 Tax=Hibiscus sabdariffa TaxID=183260 RepID=A0ABR2PNM7_9ROSI
MFQLPVVLACGENGAWGFCGRLMMIYTVCKLLSLCISAEHVIIHARMAIQLRSEARKDESWRLKVLFSSLPKDLAILLGTEENTSARIGDVLYWKRTQAQQGRLCAS